MWSSALLVWATLAVATGPDAALIERPLTEGVGLEGVLTIYDETPRMFRSLGEPTRAGGGKYVYEGAGIKLVIAADYRDGKFPITAITASGSDDRVRTGTGVRLGDEPAQVVAVLGEPTSRTDSELGYPGLGVTFTLGKPKGAPSNAKAGSPRRVVTAITITRPELTIQAAAPEPGVPPIPPAPETKVPAVLTSGETLVPFGVDLVLGKRWTKDAATEPFAPGAVAARFALDRSAATLRVDACADCQAAVEERVRTREGELGPNRLTDGARRFDDRMKELVQADDGYAGVYGPPILGRTTWVLALRRGARTVLIELELSPKAGSDLVLDSLSEVVGLLRSLRLVVPL